MYVCVCMWIHLYMFRMGKRWFLSTTAMYKFILSCFSAHSINCLPWCWLRYCTLLKPHTYVLDLGFTVRWWYVSPCFLQTMAQGMCGGAALLQTRWLRGTCTCGLCMCSALDSFGPCNKVLKSCILHPPTTECTEHYSTQPWSHQCEEGGLKWFFCLSPGEQEGVQVRSVQCLKLLEVATSPFHCKGMIQPLLL